MAFFRNGLVGSGDLENSSHERLRNNVKSDARKALVISAGENLTETHPYNLSRRNVVFFPKTGVVGSDVSEYTTPEGYVIT